jgi:hypothetical protein
MEDWNFQNRSPVCSQCQTMFEAKSECFTVLSRANADYVRQDLCRSCWEAAGGPSIREKMGVISSWQGTYEPPPPPPVDPLPKEDAESLLRKMAERNDPAESETKYILAVMLERKRILKHRETQKTEEKLLVYEHVKTGEVFLIQDPQLRLDQLVEVQKKVSAMLSSAGPGKEASSAVPAETAETAEKAVPSE